MKRKKWKTIAAKSASRLEDEDTGRREAKDRVSYQLFLHLFIGRATTPSYHRGCCFPSFPLDSNTRRHSFLAFSPFLPSIRSSFRSSFAQIQHFLYNEIISTKENEIRPCFPPSSSFSSSSFILVNFFRNRYRYRDSISSFVSFVTFAVESKKKRKKKERKEKKKKENTKKYSRSNETSLSLSLSLSVHHPSSFLSVFRNTRDAP